MEWMSILKSFSVLSNTVETCLSVTLSVDAFYYAFCCQPCLFFISFFLLMHLAHQSPFCLVTVLMCFLLFAGGGCKICGSVEHFRRNCPELVQQTKGNKSYPSTFSQFPGTLALVLKYRQVREKMKCICNSDTQPISRCVFVS